MPNVPKPKAWQSFLVPIHDIISLFHCQHLTYYHKSTILFLTYAIGIIIEVLLS